MYKYGTWLVWLLELIWCQLFLALGAPAGQLKRRSGVIRGSLAKLTCGWQITHTSRSKAAQPVLPVTAQQAAEPAIVAVKADVPASSQPDKDAGKGGEDDQAAAAAQPLMQPAGEVAEMNLSDALSGLTCCSCIPVCLPPGLT